uniref:Transmembrane protein 88B n=1 Tax=Marmota marmota marmota TaxID=9994 RepID=A0A8C5YLV8_MARMA
MSDQERETEEDEGGGTLDTAPMLPQRPPDHHTSAPRSSGWSGLAIRGLKTLLLPGRALAVLLLHLLLPGTVFLLLLLPAAGIVYLGFLCHSRVSLGKRKWDFGGDSLSLSRFHLGLEFPFRSSALPGPQQLCPPQPSPGAAQAPPRSHPSPGPAQ